MIATEDAARTRDNFRRLLFHTSRMKVFLLAVATVLSPVLSSVLDNEVSIVNNRPIIGVLTQELSPDHARYPEYKSFIPASYIKFIEGAGGRAAPIWINQTLSYYENILSRINGVLFPGGGVNFDARGGYGDAGAYIYAIAEDFNRKGDYFPLWGTCMGFELLAYLGANRTNPLVNCSTNNLNLNLNFLTDYNTSRLFGSAPQDIIRILASEPITANFHHYCLTLENLTQYMGDEHWRVISLNKDAHNLVFISTMESRDMPAYGVQFHPEKSPYEWSPRQNTAHSEHAIRIAQYFADFFVDEARKSSHSFFSKEDERKALIYNYPVTYTGYSDHYLNEQQYLFH